MYVVTKRAGFMALMSFALAAAAGAEPVEVDLLPVDNSAGGPELEGFTTTDIVLTIRDGYVGSQLFIELEQGTIFQHPEGGTTAPNPGLVQLFPPVEFDTYIANGSHSTNGAFDPFIVIGAAVNLADRGSRPLTFSESLVDVAWAADPSNAPDNEEDFVTARITLSNDARGQWLYLASGGGHWAVIAPDTHPIFEEGGAPLVSGGFGVIQGGELHLQSVVPEPATLGLLAATMVVGIPLLLFRRAAW